MFKILSLFLAVFLFFSSTAIAGHVKDYVKSDGTYVHSYERSNPNGTVMDNYSYKGNVNPSTGAVGTNYYKNSPTSEYYEPVAPTPQAFPSFDASQSSHTPTIDVSCMLNCENQNYQYYQCQQICTK